LAQPFPRRFNTFPLFAAAAGIALPVLAVGFFWYYGSPKYTDVGYRPIQPVPYSHKLHVGELGLDCRYCHASVEISAVANIPPTQTCMNCHRLVKRDSEKLAPIRDSAATGRPMRWIRVHKLPDYAYFTHRAHVAAGIGCVTCHGRIDEMEVVTQMKPLSMSWCLDCHRDPAPNRRPVAEVTNMRWTPPKDAGALAARLAKEHPVHPPVNCSGCHR
jgi:Cytochrome c7 and related cytochrome c